MSRRRRRRRRWIQCGPTLHEPIEVSHGRAGLQFHGKLEARLQRPPASRRAPRRIVTTTWSSSAPASPGSTCCTACAAWASRSASTSWAPGSAAPGSGTATRARAATSRAWSTRTSSRRSSSRSGSGASATPRSPRSCATSTTWPTASICAATSSSRPASSRRPSTRPTGRWDDRVARAGGDAEHVSGAARRARHRLPLGAQHAEVPRPRQLQGPEVPHRQLAARGRRLHRQARRASSAPAPRRCSRSRSSPSRRQHLYVFQRTPNYSIPARNEPLAPEEVQRVKADYDALRQRASQVGFGIDLAPRDRTAKEDTPEERKREFEERWKKGGFGFLGAYSDIVTDTVANESAQEFVREKIRAGGQGPEDGRAAARPRPPSAASACASTPTTSRPSTGPTSR